MRYIAHKKARKLVQKINSERNNYLFIHYSCESFRHVTDRTVRITSIVVKSLRSHQTISFSISMEAEKLHMILSQLEPSDYDRLEKNMLKAFYKFMRNHIANYKWIHWNMRDANFGFQAIEHRARCLNVSDIAQISDVNKIDLAVLLKDYYGTNYAQHPRMMNLLKKNALMSDRILSGEEEANAFNNHHYSKLHQSTLAKVEAFSQIFNMICDGTLKTDATKKDMYGGRIQYWCDAVISKWWIKMILWFIPIAIGIICAFCIP